MRCQKRATPEIDRIKSKIHTFGSSSEFVGCSRCKGIYRLPSRVSLESVRGTDGWQVNGLYSRIFGKPAAQIADEPLSLRGIASQRQGSGRNPFYIRAI